MRTFLAMTIAVSASACLTKPPLRAKHDAGSSDSAAGADARSGLLLGDQRAEQCVDSHSAGVAEASSFVAVANGTVTSLSIDYPDLLTATTLVLALYDDDPVHFTPRTLLAKGTYTQASAIGPGIYTASTDVQVPVTQGTRYWISVFCPTGTCEFRYTYAPGAPSACCFGDPCVGAPTCTAADSSCTVHSASSSLTAPESTWTLGGAAFGLSANSYWASGG